MKFPSSALSGLLAMGPLIAVAGPHVEWYVAYGHVNEQRSVKLGDKVETVSLANKWSCSVGSPSPGGSVETICQKGNEAFEFTVQCDLVRTKDHTQIRFNDAASNLNEFIDVGCELFE